MLNSEAFTGALKRSSPLHKCGGSHPEVNSLYYDHVAMKPLPTSAPEHFCTDPYAQQIR